MSAAQRQFDFWIGQWTVSQNGAIAGASRIESILDGCGLLESWTGASGTRGSSITAYDAARGCWHQTWVDTGGTVLYLDGGLERGVMTLTGAARDGDATVRQGIRWTPGEDGSARQQWDAFRELEGRWRTLFDGLYRRTE